MRSVKSRTGVVLVATAVAVIGSVSCLASAGLPNRKAQSVPKAADAEALLKKAMLDDARKVFEQDITRYKNGVGGTVEELYLWSSRWLEAELDLAGNAEAKTTALKTHLEHMKEVEKIATASAKAGVGRDADATAARYYRTQAELWLARGRTK